jgi:hypothetical protein
MGKPDVFRDKRLVLEKILTSAGSSGNSISKETNFVINF